MPANEQFSVTLDTYHKWAVDRLVNVMKVSRSDLVLWAVRDWVANHPNHVVDAQATLAHFDGAPERKGRR